MTIIQIIKEYLANIEKRQLAEEAKRQSILASKLAQKANDEIWNENQDTSDWL